MARRPNTSGFNFMVCWKDKEKKRWIIYIYIYVWLKKKKKEKMIFKNKIYDWKWTLLKILIQFIWSILILIWYKIDKYFAWIIWLSKIEENQRFDWLVKFRELTSCCQNEGSCGGTAGGDSGHKSGGEFERCLGHMCTKDIEGCPHTCRGLKWCIGVVIGGKPMIGANHGFPSLFPPPAYNCLLWLQLAASASRASKCFLWDLYFCIQT